MAAPGWTDKAKVDAKRDALVLFKVELNGKHTKKGSYSCSGACTTRTAMLLASIVNTSDRLPEEDIRAIEDVFGINR